MSRLAFALVLSTLVACTCSDGSSTSGVSAEEAPGAETAPADPYAPLTPRPRPELREGAARLPRGSRDGGFREARMANDLYMRAQSQREKDPAVALELFRKVMTLTEPGSDLHRKSKAWVQQLERAHP